MAKVGDIVSYNLSERDGGDPAGSAEVPAIVVAVNADSTVNLQVFHDAPGLLYRQNLETNSDGSYGAGMPDAASLPVPAVGVAPAGAEGGPGASPTPAPGDQTQAVGTTSDEVAATTPSNILDAAIEQDQEDVDADNAKLTKDQAKLDADRKAKADATAAPVS